MARLTRKMVSTIRKQLAKLKELDLKKMSDGISHGEKKQWSQYYAGVLKLFDPSQTRMVEERDTIRIPMTTEVLYQIDKQKFSSNCWDLSVSGIGLAFNSDVSVDDVVSLRFNVKTAKLKFFEEEHSVACEGIVKWSSSKDNRTGIEFHQLDEELKMLIHRSLFDEIERQIKRALNGPDSRAVSCF